MVESQLIPLSPQVNVPHVCYRLGNPCLQPPIPIVLCSTLDSFPLQPVHKVPHATLRRDGEPSAAHCPSRGHMDGLYWVSLGRQGRLRCRHRFGVVSYRRPDGWRFSALFSLDNEKIFMLTCWLISTMPMSLRSVVNLSKVASIVALSVLLSTTRKFFCESGGGVTC